MRGLQRAVTMAGLIMFSKLILSSTPPLPGKTGQLLQESFGILEQLNKAFSNYNSKKTETFLHKLDRTLCEISGYK